MKTREIKFRAWDGIDYMSKPFDLYDLQDKAIQFSTAAAIMQFSGQRDANGVDIYEEDICECDVEGPDNTITFKGVMRWWKERSQFSVQFSSAIDFTKQKIKAVRVIGNTFQNPELLTT